MRTTLLLLAGVSLGLASWLLTRSLGEVKEKGTQVADLAKNLEHAWADHHTVA